MNINHMANQWGIHLPHQVATFTRLILLGHPPHVAAEHANKEAPSTALVPRALDFGHPPQGGGLPPPQPGFKTIPPAHDNLKGFIAQIDLSDTDSEAQELIAYRLAQHGITSTGLLATIDEITATNILKENDQDIGYSPRYGEPAVVARLKFALHNARHVMQYTTHQPPPTHMQPDTSQLKPLVDSHHDLSKYLKKAGKRKKPAHLREDHSSSSEDETYDITKGLREAGLGTFTRTEYIDPHRLHRMHKQAEKDLNRSRPYISTNSHKLVASWIPQATKVHGPQPDRARRALNDRKHFNSLAHFLRHKATMLLSHVAIHVLDVPSMLWYLLELIEFADAHSLEAAIAYDNGRTRTLQAYIDLHTEHNASQGTSIAEQARHQIQEGLPPCTTPAEARLFMGKFLRQVDHELARDCASGILKPAATRGDDRRDQNDRRDSRRGGDGTPEKPPKRPRHDDRDATRRADKADKNAVSPDKNKKPYICFLEDPRNSKTCPEGSKCTKLHLNTTIKEEADRYDKALAAHEASKASRADRKKKVT